MNSEHLGTHPTIRFAGARAESTSRAIVRLTLAERKLLLLALDLLLINVSLLLAATIWVDFRPSITMLIAYAKWFVTLSLVWWICATVLDIYDLERATKANGRITASGLAALLTAIIYVLIPVLTPRIASRSYVLGFVVLSTMSVVVWRFVYTKSLSQSAFQRHVLIVGTGSAAQVLFRELTEARKGGKINPWSDFGYQIVGLVPEPNAYENASETGLPVLGNISEIVRIARQYHVDEIAVGLNEECGVDPKTYDALLDCSELGWQLSTLPSLYERLTARLPVEYATHDLETLSAHGETAGYHIYRASKRLMDVILALAGCIPLGLVIPWVALGNALFSPGPLFYRQQRVGRGGRVFAILKFRSMVVNAERATGAVWSRVGDSRITPMGRFLRKARLDELPQIINVLKGEMSMVGPRPERPCFVAQLGRELPVYRVRHSVLPGITGWAQIRYKYGSSVEDSRVKLEYDLYYVKHASLYVDLRILLQTVPTMLGLKGQ